MRATERDDDMAGDGDRVGWHELVAGGRYWLQLGRWEWRGSDLFELCD